MVAVDDPDDAIVEQRGDGATTTAEGAEVTAAEP
jgi:hypothetical protein